MDKKKKQKKSILQVPFKSIRTAMLISFSALIVITLMIFSLISLNYTEKTVLSNSIDYTSRLIKQVNSDIDSYIDYMENISSLVVNNSDVQNYLFNQVDTEGSSSLFQNIITQFNTVVETREDISNIGVIAVNGESIINNGEDRLNRNISLSDVDWYAKVLAGEETTLTSSHVQNVIKNNYKWVVTLSRGITNPYSEERAGVFFIDLNYKVIRDLCESNNLETNYIFIIDKNGKIIYHPQQQLLYSGLKKEKIDEVLECKSNYFVTEEGAESKLYTVSTSDKTGWSVVGVSYLSDFMKNKEETEHLYLLTAVLLLLFALILAILLSTAITWPIKQLKDSMREMEQGNFENATIEVTDHNEIGSLSNSFNIMIYKIKQLMEQNTYEQEQKRISELKALQSQINPHFLYNTLDSIIWMAEGKKNEEVVVMTSSLAKLLRQSISNENEVVTIQREIEYVKSYLTIQKMRYQDKLDFEIEIAEDILNTEIVKLVLQPIVENAIYHGIKYKETKGMIAITGYRKEDDIIIEIRDNGIGMDEETLATILKKHKSDESVNGGVGVYNVQMRLQLFYGNGYGISYESRHGEGTKATIRIPRLKAVK